MVKWSNLFKGGGESTKQDRLHFSNSWSSSSELKTTTTSFWTFLGGSGRIETSSSLAIGGSTTFSAIAGGGDGNGGGGAFAATGGGGEGGGVRKPSDTCWISWSTGGVGNAMGCGREPIFPSSGNRTRKVDVVSRWSQCRQSMRNVRCETEIFWRRSFFVVWLLR